jgi:hypothetical protein
MALDGGGLDVQFQVELPDSMRDPEAWLRRAIGVLERPPRLMLVMIPANEWSSGRKSKQRWIANDFRNGAHRTRADAARAWKRALPEMRRTLVRQMVARVAWMNRQWGYYHVSGEARIPSSPSPASAADAAARIRMGMRFRAPMSTGELEAGRDNPPFGDLAVRERLAAARARLAAGDVNVDPLIGMERVELGVDGKPRPLGWGRSWA